MSSVIISGDTSGAITVSAPAVAGTNTLTLQAATATNAVNILATALPTTSGTTADFTGLPSWIKRITVMFQNVSLTTNDYYLVQLGTGSTTYTTTGYTSTASLVTSGNTIITSTTGFIMYSALGAGFASGHMVITNITGNSWVATAVLKRGTDGVQMSAGDVTLGSALTAVRFTCNGGAFDSGTVNILYEG